MIIRTLSDCGFVTVPYPEALRQIVDDAMASWQSFCTLPKPDKNKFAQGNRDRDFGYMKRGSQGEDLKELFHLELRTIEDLAQIATTVDDRRAVNFIQSVGSLINGVAPLIAEFSSQASLNYQMPKLEDQIMANQRSWVFRFIHYIGGSELLAQPHVDRGGITLHLAESDDGGQYLSFDRQWLSWPVNRQQTIIFGGLKLQHASENNIKALCHQVTANSYSKRLGRYSIVAFIDFNYDFDFHGHGRRLQEYTPGFNYQITDEELQGMFNPIK